jgi:hypothetical protein
VGRFRSDTGFFGSNSRFQTQTSSSGADSKSAYMLSTGSRHQLIRCFLVSLNAGGQ